MDEAMRLLDADVSLRVTFLNTLRTIVSKRLPKNKAGAALVSDYDLIRASTAEYAEAFLKTLKLWENHEQKET